ncbi:hypothetical protein NHP21005_11880 [Helicobacter sp. NHP21005]|nr:hypothetical protein NHP21005_11880 [Helicobacter sp. NHP21005]
MQASTSTSASFYAFMAFATTMVWLGIRDMKALHAKPTGAPNNTRVSVADQGVMGRGVVEFDKTLFFASIWLFISLW